MDVIEAMLQRVSAPRQEGPGPTAEQLDTLLRAAIRAPDHGQLRPWRFIVLQGEDRQKLGDIFVEALLADQPGADQAAIDKARSRPLRSPVVIVAVAEVDPDLPKIPPIDQIMATASAVENMMIAAHHLGLGAMWRTGAWAQNPLVKRRLGFAEKDEIVSFFYLGTPAGSLKPVPREEPSTYLRRLPR